jgi:hypothetical protein
MAARFSALGLALAGLLVTASDVSAQSITIAANQPIQISGSTYSYSASGSYTLAANQAVLLC